MSKKWLKNRLYYIQLYKNILESLCLDFRSFFCHFDALLVILSSCHRKIYLRYQKQEINRFRMESKPILSYSAGKFRFAEFYSTSSRFCHLLITFYMLSPKNFILKVTDWKIAKNHAPLDLAEDDTIVFSRKFRENILKLWRHAVANHPCRVLRKNRNTLPQVRGLNNYYFNHPHRFLPRTKPNISPGRRV